MLLQHFAMMLKDFVNDDRTFPKKGVYLRHGDYPRTLEVWKKAAAKLPQEIAIRRSLGATSQKVMRTFLWRNNKRLLWGLLFGAPMTVMLYLLFDAILEDLALIFFSLYVVAVLIIAIISSAASIIPLYKATRGEPAYRLHHQ